MPREQPVAGFLKRKLNRATSSVGGVDATVPAEASLGTAGLVQLVDGYKGFGEVGHAAHVADEKATPSSFGVLSDDGEIANAFDPFLLPVDSGHGLVGFSAVDQVAGCGVTMHGAATVDDQSKLLGITLAA